MNKARYGLLAGVVLATSSAVVAQLEVGGSALDNCSQIDALRKAGNLTEARDKAQVCLEALEQEVTGSVGKLFSAEVAGWTRTNIQQENVLGFSNVTATYTKGETMATVALTGTGGDGGGPRRLARRVRARGPCRNGSASPGCRLAGHRPTRWDDHGDARGRLILDVLLAELQHARDGSRWLGRSRQRVPGRGHQQGAAVALRRRRKSGAATDFRYR